MITKDKRQLMKNISEVIGAVAGDESSEDFVRGMYDPEVDKLMEQILAMVGEEANVDEVFDLITIKDWVDDNFQRLFPSIEGVVCIAHYTQEEIDTWVKKACQQVRIDAVYSTKEIQRFVREE